MFCYKTVLAYLDSFNAYSNFSNYRIVSYVDKLAARPVFIPQIRLMIVYILSATFKLKKLRDVCFKYR